MKYKAVLFDLDGTLLDTIEDLTDSMNAGLRELGFPVRTVDECKVFVGDGVENFARRAIPEGKGTEETIARCMELMRNDYAHRWTSKTRAYEGVDELLRGLLERGVAAAILSNKPDDFTRQMVRHFFGEGAFEIVLGARAETPLKPDPAGALGIARELNLSGGEIIYLGDTNTDMRTARSADMYAVGALWGFRSAAELTSAGAQTLIARPPDLLELL